MSSRGGYADEGSRLAKASPHPEIPHVASAPFGMTWGRSSLRSHAHTARHSSKRKRHTDVKELPRIARPQRVAVRDERAVPRGQRDVARYLPVKEHVRLDAEVPVVGRRFVDRSIL